MSTLDDLNEDWIKTLAWDLPDDLAGFLRVVGDRAGVEHFLTLPAARAMPAGLRLDIEHWLGGHPTTSPAAPAPTAAPAPPVIRAAVTPTGVTLAGPFDGPLDEDGWWGDPDRRAAAIAFAFDEGQERDDHGRWTSGGGDGYSPARPDAGIGSTPGDKVSGRLGGGTTNYGGLGVTHPADAGVASAHAAGQAQKASDPIQAAHALGQAEGIRDATTASHHEDPGGAKAVHDDARARAAAASTPAETARQYGRAEGAASVHDGIVREQTQSTGGRSGRTEPQIGTAKWLPTDQAHPVPERVTRSMYRSPHAPVPRQGLVITRRAAAAVEKATLHAIVTRDGITFDYNPDQERGPDGRWDGGDSKQAALDRAKTVEAKVGAAVKAGLETDKLFEHGTDGLPPGKYTPEREAMHDRIIDQFLAKSEGVPRDRQAVFSGGLPGAGKSSMLAQAGIDEHNYLTVNPDEMKEAIIREGGLPKDPMLDGLKPMEQASIIHEESSALAMRLADEASARGTNLVWDITMNKASSVNERLDRLPGYTTKAMFVEVSPETSKASALDRYMKDVNTPMGGRFIEPSTIDKMKDPTYGSVNRATFEQTKGRFDSYELWSREHGQAPTLVERGGHAG